MQVTNMAREPRWRPPPTCSWWARSRDGDFTVCREAYVPPCAGQHHVVCPRPQRCGKGLTIHGEAGKGLAENRLEGRGIAGTPPTVACCAGSVFSRKSGGSSHVAPTRPLEARSHELGPMKNEPPRTRVLQIVGPTA